MLLHKKKRKTPSPTGTAANPLGTGIHLSNADYKHHSVPSVELCFSAKLEQKTCIYTSPFPIR
uniref:Uncharacterized protein n=1 Tax=Anguilla anguilla TaxID=7936 RepID=A0A0E9W7K7_ANGAN